MILSLTNPVELHEKWSETREWTSAYCMIHWIKLNQQPKDGVNYAQGKRRELRIVIRKIK